MSIKINFRQMKNHLKIYILLTFLMLTMSVYAQKILLQEDVKAYFSNTDNYGPNLRHFRWVYLNYGHFADSPEYPDFGTIPLRTYAFSGGIYYKLKLARFYSIGIGTEYNLNNFTISQIAGKTFPTQTIHTKERVRLHRVGLEAYQRLSFGNRGNVMGFFLDIGYYYNYAFSTRLIILDKYDKPMYGAKTIEILYKNLEFVNNFNYGARVRLGYNRYSVFADYRVSDLLDSNIGVQMPRLAVGLQLALH